VKTVLDACCGARMCWFDKEDARAIFVDNRVETHVVTDRSHGRSDGRRTIVVRPDVRASFEALPFSDESFALVVFDPPHLTHAGRGWKVKKYGTLGKDWRGAIARGFAECFRVLRSEGVLVFKWSEHDVPLADVLALTPERPLFGQRRGAGERTYFIVFQKRRED
jgi:SAM-dependent methyltransferase